MSITAIVTTTTAESTTATTSDPTQSTTVSVTSGDGTDTAPAQTTTTAPPEPDVLKGDVNGNGEVSVDDAQLALKAYTRRIAGVEMGLTEQQYKAANVNEDDELSVDDAQNILIYYVNNTVAGNVLAWEQLLGKKTKQFPAPLRLHEDLCPAAVPEYPEPETD